MLSSSAPTKTTVPFGNSGSKNIIPVASQIGIVDGAASYTDGFPPLTYTDPTAGGIAPAAQDFNGILFAITQQLQWNEAGGLPKFDSTFATAVGGYPAGSVLQSADSFGFWISTADNNTANPDTGGAGWVPSFFYGNATQAAGGVAITLTNVQASKPMITVSGTLTANVAITFPPWIKQWVLINNTSGAFVLTAKTATGSAITLLPGSNLIYGDGSNILSNGVVTTQSFTSAQTLATTGHLNFPGGLELRWGSVAFSDVTGGTPGSTGSVTFDTPFSSACWMVLPGFSVASGTTNNWQFATTAVSTTGFSYQLQEWSAAVNPGTLNWIALGK